MTIVADPKHPSARIGITAVLDTCGSVMRHHPNAHMIVSGGGIAPDESRWISSRPAFLRPVRMLGKLFRRMFLTRMVTRQRSVGDIGTFKNAIALPWSNGQEGQIKRLNMLKRAMYRRAGPELMGRECYR